MIAQKGNVPSIEDANVLADGNSIPRLGGRTHEIMSVALCANEPRDVAGRDKVVFRVVKASVGVELVGDFLLDVFRLIFFPLPLAFVLGVGGAGRRDGVEAGGERTTCRWESVVGKMGMSRLENSLMRLTRRAWRALTTSSTKASGIGAAGACAGSPVRIATGAPLAWIIVQSPWETVDNERAVDVEGAEVDKAGGTGWTG